MENKTIKNLLIIGNGFDLSLGMKTGYKDFYEYLLNNNFFQQNQSNVLINYVRNVNNKKYWFDFEGILKEFATKSIYAQQLNQCHKAIEYLEESVSEINIEISQLKKLQLVNDICPNYSRLLTDLNEFDFTKEVLDNINIIINQIKDYCEGIKKDVEEGVKKLTEKLFDFLTPATPTHENKYFPAEWIISAMYGAYDSGRIGIAKKIANDEINNEQPDATIVSFNYTDTLYHITHIIERCNIPISDEIHSLKNNIYNIHGNLRRKDIVFGIDDEKSVCKEFNILRKSLLVKDDSRKIISNLLNSANRIIIFGHSIFAIDYIYYKDFFESNISKEKEIYIICIKDDIEKIKTQFIDHGISLSQKKIIASDLYNDEFIELCSKIAEEQKK